MGRGGASAATHCLNHSQHPRRKGLMHCVVALVAPYVVP